MACRVIFDGDSPVPLVPVPTAQVASGSPASGLVEFDVVGADVGVWEHTVGVSTDVEADEVFVVISGRATITVRGSEEPPLRIGPGDVIELEAGAETIWDVHETVRKLWLLPQR